MLLALLLVNVTLVDVRTGTELPHRSVVIEGDRVVRVEDAAPGAPFGGFVIPGLWDMHAHTRGDERTRRVVFPLDIANGATGIRDMQADCAAPPCPEDKPTLAIERAWKADIAQGKLVGPRIVSSSAWLDGRFPRAAGTYSVATPEAARAAVHDAASRGADFVKIYSSLARDAYFAAVDEAARVGIRLAGHLPNTIQPKEARQWTIDHLYRIPLQCEHVDLRPLDALLHDPAATREAYRRAIPRPKIKPCDFSALAGMAVVPTLNLHFYDSMLDLPEVRQRPYFRYFPKSLRAEWESFAKEALAGATPEDGARAHAEWKAYLAVARALHEAGVRLYAGSDSDIPFGAPGFQLQEELGHLVEAGLTPLQALQSATVDSEKLLGIPSDAADLVVLDADPLQDISNTRRIRAVVARGRLFDRAALDAMLAEVEAWSAQH